MPLIKKLHLSIWKLSSKLGPFAPLIAMLVLGLVILSATRLGLVLWKFERVTNTGKLAEILLQGIRVDVIQLCLIAFIPLLLSPILATQRLFKVWQKFSYVWVSIALVLLVFLEAATPGFISEYDVRPNRIFVEYLKYPHEVFSMLWGGFKLEIFSALGAVALAVWLVRKFMRPWLTMSSGWSNTRVWLVWPLIVILAALGIRSTLGHRPANPALFAITADNMVNSLVLNSGYSVIYATYNLMKETKSSDIYGKMPREEIFSITGAKDTDIPTLTTLHPSQKRDKPLNLVIILQESLGATFVESLGGVPSRPT